MKITTIMLLIIPMLFLSSCGKNYNCTCTNPGGSNVVFTTHSNKTKAEQKCKKYYDDHYGNVVMSETNCTIE